MTAHAIATEFVFPFKLRDPISRHRIKKQKHEKNRRLTQPVTATYSQSIEKYNQYKLH